jgi:hypothetical protein
MAKRDALTRTLAIVGTVLAWIPILAPVLFSVMVTIRRRVFRFDYLMSAELFPVVPLGGAALLWAALRARSRHKLIAWSLGVTVGLLVGGQLLAVLTGLASGETEPTGWPWILVLASLAGYTLALVVMAAGGALLWGDLSRNRQSPATGAGHTV